MAVIISMLLIIPFLREKKYGRFLAFYVLFLLITPELRIGIEDYTDIHTDGKYFFRYYADIQFLMLGVTGYLLDGWYRIIIASTFVLFTIYNYILYVFWGYITMEYYSYIALGLIVFQTFVVTFSEPIKPKNIILMVLISLATLGQGYFL